MDSIDRNFDDFSKEEIREQISNMFKDKCMEFLQMKLESVSGHDLKEQFESVLKEAYEKSTIMPYYEIKTKRTKLPRKLKKKYKKEQRICFGFEYIEYKQPKVIEFTIPIKENEVIE